ncbi:MAG: hypothetical protein KGP29_07405 [Proteobacteria bacterium]|nr:hypothetical protein [Pseudomonadota bacterium]
MKKLLLIFLLFSCEAFAAECHLQRNSIGFENYEVCEVEGTGYACASLEDKTRGGISCFPIQKISERDSSSRRLRGDSDSRY